MILPNLFDKAFLLLTQYNEKILYENKELTPITKSYRIRHDEIDCQIIEDKKRVK